MVCEDKLNWEGSLKLGLLQLNTNKLDNILPKNISFAAGIIVAHRQGSG
jgi:hypothetical protein